MVSQQVRAALAVLRRGGVVAYPTDTVYGLGSHGLNPDGVRRVFAIKGRPLDQPVPLLVADIEMLAAMAEELSPRAVALVQRFMPGPLTLVLRRSKRVPDIVAAGGATVAVRIPSHPVPRALAAGLGAPIVGTSANRSGQPSATEAEEVRSQLGGEVDYICDGHCGGGVESTILDLTREPPRILRQGPVPLRELEEALGLSLAS